MAIVYENTRAFIAHMRERARHEAAAEAVSPFPVKSPCPGCGAAMFALSFGTDIDGVSKLNSWTPGFATFSRTETADLVCANGCEVLIRRVSGEEAQQVINALPALPLLAELHELVGKTKGKKP